MPKDATKIILKDNTQIENGLVGYSEGFLWCYLTGYTMQQAATIFLDKSKTETIVFVYGAESDVYEGFTECINIKIDVDGRVSVCMERGVSE